MAYNAAMHPTEWRNSQNLTAAAAARLLGVVGVNPGGTLIRIENGERQPDADMIERLVRLSDGAVSAADMHNVRLEWLKTNRPDKIDRVDTVHAFDRSQPQPAAALNPDDPDAVSLGVSQAGSASPHAAEPAASLAEAAP